MKFILNPKKLSELRKRKNFSQRKLSQISKVEQSTISRIEAGIQDDVSATRLFAIGKALNSDFSKFFKTNKGTK